MQSSKSIKTEVEIVSSFLIIHLFFFEGILMVDLRKINLQKMKLVSGLKEDGRAGV